MINIEDVITVTENARDTWAKAISHLEDISFDVNSSHSVFGLSVADFSEGLLYALELGATSGQKIDSSIVDMLNISPAFQGMQNTAEQIRNSSQVISDFFEAAVREKADITINNPNMLTDAKNRRLDLAAQLKQLKSAGANYVNHLALLHDFLLQEEMSDLASRIRRFREAGSELLEILKEARSDSRKVTGLGKKVEGVFSAIAEQQSEVDKIRAEVKGIGNTAAELINEANSKLATIRETTAKTDSLRERVEQYESQFSAFDEALDERLKMLGEFELRTKQATKDNESREEEIDRLIDKANKMLEGATNAGLAKSFNDASEKYAESASTAKNFFYLSIFLLGVSSIPLATYVFPVPFIDKAIDAEGGAITFGGILARAVLLLPTVWLATFAAHRYSALFHLHREYGFKAAIAMSVEGFKQQAPKYEEEIAGATFVELSNKPEFDSSKKATKAPNPIMAYWIKQMQKRFENMSGQD